MRFRQNPAYDVLYVDVEVFVAFEENGYLLPGLHEWTYDRAEKALVREFPESSSRSDIMEGYVRLRSLFKSFNIACEHWLDGSFCSTKVDPQDLDIVVVADLHEIDRLPWIGQQLWKSLVNGPETKAAYRCDSYFCPTVPADDPLEEFCNERRSYWLKQFGRDRQGIAKGIVKLVVPEVDQPGDGS